MIGGLRRTGFLSRVVASLLILLEFVGGGGGGRHDLTDGEVPDYERQLIHCSCKVSPVRQQETTKGALLSRT